MLAKSRMGTSFYHRISEDKVAAVSGGNFIGLAISTVIGVIVFVQVLLPTVEAYTGAAESDPMMVALIGIIPVAFVAGLIYFVLRATDVA